MLRIDPNLTGRPMESMRAKPRCLRNFRALTSGNPLTRNYRGRKENGMIFGCRFLVLMAVVSSLGCMGFPTTPEWHRALDRHTDQLGYRNWIVVAEASFPAQSRPGIHQVNAAVDIPEALDYVLGSLEQKENVRPRLYVPRELRSVENDYAPGIDYFRKRLENSLHGYEPTELEQQSLLTLLEDANRSFDVLVIRTTTPLPYSSVFIELQPGYWDADAENRLREKIDREHTEKNVRGR